MDPVTGLSFGRIAIGAAALAAPDFTMKAFGLDGESNRQLPYMARMFGSRELAVGIATLLAKGKARRNWVAAGILIDLADAVAGSLAAQDGYVSKGRGAFLTAPALGAVGAGVAGLRGSARP
jgi:hypothetical protein